MNNNGFAHLYLLIAAITIVAFLIISNTFNFKNGIFSNLYSKPPANASFTKSSLHRTLPNNSLLTLHQQGKYIVDENNNPVMLKGVNLGGWLYWEGYIFGVGLISQTDVLNKLQVLVGASAVNKFQTDIYNNFITEADFAKISSLGFNSVRLPFNYRILEDSSNPYVYKQSGWDLLDKAISWANKYNVYVILEMHSIPGGQSPYLNSDPTPGNLVWQSEDNKLQTIALWKAIAQRYKNQKNVAGYDLMNEPIPPSNQDLIDLYSRIITGIRQVDSKHLVILEGGNFAQDFSMFTQPLDKNMMYSFHMYTITGDYRKPTMANYKALSQTQQVPIWAGEFGEDSYDNIASTLGLYNDPSNNVSGWSFWLWKRVPAIQPNLNLIPLTDNWRSVEYWMTSVWFQPSTQVAQAGMNDFINSVNIQNNIPDSKLTNILQLSLGSSPVIPSPSLTPAPTATPKPWWCFLFPQSSVCQ